jgi:hypothetical protein
MYSDKEYTTIRDPDIRSNLYLKPTGRVILSFHGMGNGFLALSIEYILAPIYFMR